MIFFLPIHVKVLYTPISDVCGGGPIYVKLFFYFGFADDIPLLSNEMSKAQDLLNSILDQCKNTGLLVNSGQTKFMALNSPPGVKLFTDEEIKKAEGFKYLGFFIMRSEKYIKIRKTETWTALNGMSKTWKSDISRNVKARFCFATVESLP